MIELTREEARLCVSGLKSMRDTLATNRRTRKIYGEMIEKTESLMWRLHLEVIEENNHAENVPPSV